MPLAVGVSEEIVQENNVKLFGPEGGLPYKCLASMRGLGKVTGAISSFFLSPRQIWERS